MLLTPAQIKPKSFELFLKIYPGCMCLLFTCVYTHIHARMHTHTHTHTHTHKRHAQIKKKKRKKKKKKKKRKKEEEKTPLVEFVPVRLQHGPADTNAAYNTWPQNNSRP